MATSTIGFADASAPPPPYYETFSPDAATAAPKSSEELFREIVNKHEISIFFSSKLQKLTQFKTVFIFDDSGSMNTTLDDSPLNTGLMKAKRWDELKYFAKIGLEIVNLFNPNGCTNVYFLNRPSVQEVRSAAELEARFVHPPNGYTPLSRVLTTVLRDNERSTSLQERKLLVVIVTDGEPTDDSGRSHIDGFRHALKSRADNVFTTIVSCTDEDDTMSYLNNWDKNIPRLDIIDDYRSERNEIKKVQGKSFSFTFGDYVVKCLIGSFDEASDRLDEKKFKKNKHSCQIV